MLKPHGPVTIIARNDTNPYIYIYYIYIFIKKGNNEILPNSLQGLISLQIMCRNVPKCTQLLTNNISLFKKKYSFLTFTNR